MCLPVPTARQALGGTCTRCCYAACERFRQPKTALVERTRSSSLLRQRQRGAHIVLRAAVVAGAAGSLVGAGGVNTSLSPQHFPCGQMSTSFGSLSSTMWLPTRGYARTALAA